MKEQTELERLCSIIGTTRKPRPNPKLIKTLDSAVLKNIIYIFAPACYGKTISVRRWLNKSNVNQVWITLGEKDNVPDIFFKRLTATFHSLQPDNEMLFTSSKCETNVVSLSYHTAKMLAKGNVRQMLVFDSFQVIIKEEIIRPFAELIKKLPGNFSVLIVSQSEPDGIFSDLILRDKMSVVNKDTLIF